MRSLGVHIAGLHRHYGENQKPDRRRQPKASITAWQVSTCWPQSLYTGILLAWEKPFIKEKKLNYLSQRSFWRTLPRSDGRISSSQANIDGRKNAE